MEHVARDWVAHYSRRTPDAPALESLDKGTVTTWAALDARVGRLASVLVDVFRVRRGDRVLLLSENDPRVFELQFACMRVGAIMAPLNWRLALPELEVLCSDTDPALVVYDQPWQEVGQKLADYADVRALAWGCADAQFDYEQQLARAHYAPESGDNFLSTPTHLLYTSGTTGLPKGALSTWSTLIWQAVNIQQVDAVDGPGCKLFNPLPLFHAGGLHVLSNPLLLNGGCVAVSARFDADMAAEIMGDPSRGVTHFTAVPTIFQSITEAPAYPRGDFSRMKHAQIAGGWTPDALAAAMLEKGMVLQNHYGGTETGPAVTAMPVAEVARAPRSVGRSVMHTDVRLVTVDGVDAEVGQPGEIWVRGPSVTPTYWKRERATDPAFEGPWFRTGDAGYVDGDGYYYLVDRIKDMYKSGGENVFPAEVERILSTHPSVYEVAVVGVADGKWGEVGHAVVVARQGLTVTAADLEAFCAGKLARYKIPKGVTLVDSLPRTTTGKVMKTDLRTRYGGVTR